MKWLRNNLTFNKIVLALLFIFGVLCVFKAPGDPDFGWHYKYGEYIVQHGRILRENVFSYTFTDYKWANSYWISQVAIYITHHYLGHLIAGLLFAGVLSLSVIFYVKIVAKKSQPIILLTTLSCLLLFVGFSGSVVTNRPMYFSSLFLMFLVVILLREDKKSRLWLLPPLFLIWANMHADFVLGLFILGLYVVDRVILSLGGTREAAGDEAISTGLLHCVRSDDRIIARNNMALVIAGILSVVVTLINPYRLGLWKTLIKESHPYQFNHIYEWVPVNTDNIYYFAVYCTMLGLIVSALIGARHKLPLWYMLSLGFFSIFAVRSQYFFRIAVILGVPAFITFWNEPLSDLKKALSASLTIKFKAVFLMFLVFSILVISMVFLPNVSQCINPNYWIEEQSYPKEALDFALSNNIKGNVFNYYGWGGYMIWKYPQIKTFVDGRMPSWREGDKSVFEDYIKVVDYPKKNLKILDDYEVSWILYPTDSGLVKFLKTPNSGWKEVYSNDFSSVFVETTKFDIMHP